MPQLTEARDEGIDLNDRSHGVLMHTHVGNIQVDGQENVINIQNIIHGSGERQPGAWAEIESAVKKLSLPDGSTYDPPSLYVPLSDSDEVTKQLFSWATRQVSPSEGAVDSIVHGQHTASAVARLNETLHQAARHIEELEARRSRVRTQAASLAKDIGEIEKAAPPRAPYQPPEPMSPQTRKSHADEVARYEKRLSEHQERKKTLPQLGNQLATIEHQCTLLESEIQNVRATRERDKAQLEEAVCRARGRDLVLFLERARGAAEKALASPEHTVAGYYALLALHGLFPLLRRIFHDSWDDASTLSEDMERSLDSATKTRYLPVSTDFLLRWRDLFELMQKNREELGRMQGILDELPGGELEDFVGRARKLLATPLPEVPTYKGEYDPSTFPRHAAALAAQRSSAEDRLIAVRALEEELAEPCSRTEAVRQRAETCRAKMESAARQGALADAVQILDLAVAAQATSIPERTQAFLSLLITEVERREGEPAGSFAERCQTSRFALRDAEGTLASHASAALLDARDSLLAHREEVQHHLSQLEKARGSLLARPQQLYEEHLANLREMESSWLPPLQLTSARAMYGYRQLRPALQSSLPELIPLRKEAPACARSATTRALVSALVLIILAVIACAAGSFNAGRQETEALIGLLFFVIALGGSIASLAAMALFSKARRQFLQWSGDEEDSAR